MGGRGGQGGRRGFGCPLTLPLWYPAGGRRGFGCLLTLPLWYPPGGLPSLSPACLFTLVYFSAPIPPTPFPSGEGGDLRLFYARGFAPCIPGAVPGRHWLSLRCRKPKGGAQRFWSPACLATVVPAGGLAFFVARPPFYFSLFPAPIPPTPFPAGRGGLKVILCKGLRPLHPRG